MVCACEEVEANAHKNMQIAARPLLMAFAPRSGAMHSGLKPSGQNECPLKIELPGCSYRHGFARNPRQPQLGFCLFAGVLAQASTRMSGLAL